METKHLEQLRELRMQEKAIKASIEHELPLATEEAKALQPDGREFPVEGVGTFVLTKVPVYTLTDYRTYKGETAIKWREAFAERETLRAEASGKTTTMKGLYETFKKTTSLEPETYSYELKVLTDWHIQVAK